MKRYIACNYSKSNPRKSEYLNYLDNHINGVIRAYQEVLFPVLCTESGLTVEELTNLSIQIENHDTSKYDEEEFDAYCNYFYPAENYPKDELAFDRAWLHHQHNNPHHWQYWVLVRDEGNLVPMDMDDFSIYEMLCDWHSFHYFKDPESTAYRWYQDNKDKMILSDNTRNIVESLIEYFK